MTIRSCETIHYDTGFKPVCEAFERRRARSAKSHSPAPAGTPRHYKIFFRSLRSFICVSLAVFATGCMETRGYSIYVKNRLDTPVSICLTKTYGPLEHGWVSPEDLASPTQPASNNTPPGAILPPGKVANRQVTGRFVPGRGRAVLRVYAGTPNLSEMNAISQGSVNRLDLNLNPGWNGFDVELGVDGRMSATRIKPPPANGQN